MSPQAMLKANIGMTVVPGQPVQKKSETPSQQKKLGVVGYMYLSYK
jgi:hypothetical protein